MPFSDETDWFRSGYFSAISIILWFPKNFKRILVYKYDLYTFFSWFYDNIPKSSSFSDKKTKNPAFR